MTDPFRMIGRLLMRVLPLAAIGTSNCSDSNTQIIELPFSEVQQRLRLFFNFPHQADKGNRTQYAWFKVLTNRPALGTFFETIFSGELALYSATYCAYLSLSLAQA